MENNIPQGNTSMPAAPEVGQDGNGVKIAVAVTLFAVLGGLGWALFSKINEIPPPVETIPATTPAPTKSSAPSASPATGASATVTAGTDMNNLNAIEGDMKNIDTTADVNTSDIK